MIVIGHQDPGVQAQSVTLDRLLDQVLEVRPVRIVMKEVLSLVRSRGDMKPRAGLEYPQSSRHGWFLTFLRNCVNRSNPESRDVTPIPFGSEGIDGAGRASGGQGSQGDVG